MARGWYGDRESHSIVASGANVRKNLGMSFAARGKSKRSKSRKTYYKGKIITVPKGKNLYIGRSVKDTPPEGFSSVREIRDTLDKIERDYMKVAIDRKTFNARLMRLVGIVKQTQKGELGEPKNKRTAIAMINRMRRRWNFKPVENKAKKYPTKKQRRAAKRNIKKAHRSIAKKYGR